MKRFHLKLGILVAGTALAAAPAFAGQSPREGGSPGGNRETAVERPAPSSNSGGGSAASSTPASSPIGGSTAVSGGSSAVTTSPSAGAALSPRFAGARMAAEPQRRGGGQHAGGGHASSGQHSGGERAVPRGSSGTSGSTASTAPAGRSGGNATASTPSNNREGSDRGRERAVPSWSRPRGDHPVTGMAVDRTTLPPGRGGTVVIGGRYYNPYYPYGFGYPGFGLGLGFGFYDPWYDPWFGGYGAGYGYGGNYGYGGGYGYGGYYGTPYVYGGQGYGGYATDEEGSIRLKVKPRDAKVYVDGYFVGQVDSFDGVFQKLSLTGGGHHIEVKADGYQAAAFDALITPGQTVTYQGDLKKIQ